MSKILSGLLLAGLLGTVAQADILRVEMGAGVWQNDLSGSLSSGTPANVINADILNYDKETKGYAWMYIKHPVPVLPNLRLEYAAVDFSGASSQNFVYKGTTYNAGAQSDLTLDQIDVIMYYNILDNTAWVTLDLGLDIKVIQSDFSAVQSSGLNPVSVKETLPIPMAYGRARFEIPGVDIGVEGNVKYTAYKDSKVMDYAIKADYTLVDILPVDVGLEVGYRFENVDIDKDDFSSFDVNADLEVDGVFFGAVVKF